MNKYTLKVLLSPSYWIRNYSTNWTLDKFYRYLLDHKDEAKVIDQGPYNIILSFRGRTYNIWWANYPYAYLSEIEAIEKDGHITRSSRAVPSRATCMEFYEAFGASPEGRIDRKERNAFKLLNLIRQPEKTE